MHAADVIQALNLAPHPEGGHFRETYREMAPDGGRGTTTAIYYLLEEGQVSAWHRVDATEIWHWYAGAPLRLSIGTRDGDIEECRLGADLIQGERPQAVVPPHAWQSAESLGAWTLVGCTVAPAFLFEHFELAPPGFDPRMPPQAANRSADRP